MSDRQPRAVGRTLKQFIIISLTGWLAVATSARAGDTSNLSEPQLEDLVRRSWQYVAMYNVKNKVAKQYGGWNICDLDSKLKELPARKN